MKLNPIDPGQHTPETPRETDAGLKVKSHVKAGLGSVAFHPPALQPGVVLGVRPIAICG